MQHRCKCKRIAIRDTRYATRVRSAVRPNWASLALLLLALIAAAPLWTGPGLVNTRAGGDSPFLFIRLHQLVENLRAGVFPARWMPDAAYGLGYPFFNFYAALPYYFAAIFNLLGFDLLASIKIVQSLGFVFAAWAMFGWVRSVDKTMAWLAAVAYTFAPFHLVNVYVRGDALSEFYAFAFYPLILWAVDRVVAHPRPGSIALLALAYGGLVLTHNVSALIFSPFVLLYIVFRSWRLDASRGSWRARNSSLVTRHAIRHSSFHILHSAFGIALGLLVSAWFWLPALGEAPLVQLDAQTTGYFNYNQHFRSTDLIQSSLAFDYSIEPLHTPFAMGLAQAMATLAGVVALTITRRGSFGFRVFTLVGLTVSTAMIMPLSKPLWDSLPLLPLAQFPWRFLSVQALFTSLAAGYLAWASVPSAARRGSSRDASYSSWLAIGCGLVLTASTLPTLRPDYLPIRADEITPERIRLYEAFTTNIGTTIRAEYLPRTTLPRPYTGPALIDPNAPPRAIPIRGEAEAEQVSRGPIWQSWTVRAASDSTLAFPTLYFPGWQAAIDGQAIEARPAADLGYIEVDVPAGEHALALWFDRTPLRAGAEMASLAAAFCAAGMLVLSGRRTSISHIAYRVSHIAYRISLYRYEIGCLVLACVLAVIASAAHGVDAGEGDLVMDFDSRPWPHHAWIPTWNGDTATLKHYEYAGALTAGRPFTVSFEWSGPAAPGQLISVQLVAPSQHVFDGPQPIASSAASPLAAGVNRHTLEIPESLSIGMYYVKIEGKHVEGGSAGVFLKPIFFPGSPAASESPGWARIGIEIELIAVAVRHEHPERLTFAFDWVALKPIAANYAVSLRLHDASGRAWVAFDTQPGYGFQPTSVWLPGEQQRDTYTLTLPKDIPQDAAYSLDVVWYRVASQQEIGHIRVPGIDIGTLYGETEMSPPRRVFDVPPLQQRVDATFGDLIRLLGYDIAQVGNRLSLTLHWQALADVGADYKFFIHVFDPATERIVAQADAMPGGNAYPTSRWVEGEVVSETFELQVDTAGTYRIATGWYDPVSADRLRALDAQGNPLLTDRVIFGVEIGVP